MALGPGSVLCTVRDDRGKGVAQEDNLRSVVFFLVVEVEVEVVLGFQLADELVGLGAGEFRERRAQLRPFGIVAEMGHDGFQRRDHRIRLDGLAYGGDARLQVVRLIRLPVVEHLADGARGHVAGGRDAARTALAQAVEQEHLGAREDLELRIGVEDRRRVAPVAGGILQAHDDVRKGLDEAADQRQREADLGHGGDVIEIDLEVFLIDALDHFGEVAVEPFLRRRLVIVGRQDEHAAAADLHGMLRQHDRVGERGRAGARHEDLGLYVGVDDLFQQFHALVDAERIALAGRAEGGKTRAPLLQQPVAVLDEPVRVRAAVLPERGQNRGDDA